MSAIKFCLQLFEDLPAGRYTFTDLMARFTIHYEMMGGQPIERPDKLVYKAIYKLKAQGVLKRAEDFRGYERIH